MQEQMKMSAYDNKMRNTAYITFFFSGMCAISCGIIISILKEKLNLSFAVTGTMVSFFSIGQMISCFVSGILPGKIGMRKTVLVMVPGYCIGYLLTAFTGNVLFLILAFLLVGLAKGCFSNTDSVLVGKHSKDGQKSMQILHSCFAFGALLCPFLISVLSGISINAPMLGVSFLGFAAWLVFAFAGLPQNTIVKNKEGKVKDANAFLKSSSFWLLTGLMFFQNAAETCVTGWLVTYYKDSKILNGSLAAYTMTVMWFATLTARLMIAFVIPVKNMYRAMTIMGICSAVTYGILVFMKSPGPAVVFLFLFAMALAGLCPMATACVGRELSPLSMGVMLPVGSMGSIIFPYIIGIVADSYGLQKGMLINLIPCTGITVLGFILYLRNKNETHY